MVSPVLVSPISISSDHSKLQFQVWLQPFPDFRLSKELDAKLSSFQKKFDELLVLQADAIQLESEPTQQEP